MAWRSGAIGATATLTATLIAVVFVAVTIGCRKGTENTTSPATAAVNQDQALGLSRGIEQVRAEIAAGRLEPAESSIRRLLVGHPKDPTLQALFGEVLHQQGKIQEATAWALEMSDAGETDDVSVYWHEKAVYWNLVARNWEGAERVARHAVEAFPRQPTSHRLLAQLLSSQGRRQEASERIHQLVEMGAADAREILSLIDTSGPFDLVSFDQWVDPNDPGMFALGKARKTYVRDKKIEKALGLLENLRIESPGQSSVESFYGRLLAEMNRNDDFEAWLATNPDGIQNQGDYWAAVGTWLQNTGRDQQSIAALSRAVQINPTDRKSLRRIAAALTRLGRDGRAQGVQESLSKLDDVFRKASQANAAEAIEIGAVLESLLRPWEALGWYKIAGERGANGGFDPEQLRRRAQAIQSWEGKATAGQLALARTTKLLGFDPSEYALPAELSAVARTEKQGDTAPKSPFVFRDLADQAGIRTTLVSGYNLNELDFYLYQANGGGMALMDYDRDGRSDVYVVQAGGDPNIVDASSPDELYRQTGAVSFDRVERAAGCDGRGYGQGVCAADLNQDGWVDLVVANVGRNQLLINQGDGTFRDQTETHFPSAGRWTSSIAVGDLDGDGLPDIVEVNYVDDPLAFIKKCQGEVMACVPQTFRAASDRFLSATPDGRFVDSKTLGGDVIPRNYGLGVVIADFDTEPGNEVFVSNDADLNQYWRPNSKGDTPRLVEAAGISGNAVGVTGIAEACMGIAAGDFDRNGRLDMVVTNFYREPVDLFMQSSSGTFFDDAMRRGLDQPSRDVLGFGCQAADLDNDGWMDLSVLNGHLYDYRHEGIPYHMEPQLFRGGEKGFELETTSDQDSYFSGKRLGRTLVKGDIDRDGRVDLLANHLDAPVAMLMNESDAANWFQVQLVGRVSDRDAVGAVVRVRCGDETFTAWTMGGGGYMCTNEPILHFGLGRLESIDQVTVRWPNGKSESFGAVPINQRVMLVEGLEEVVVTP